MDDYPANISTFREKQNIPGQVYDADKKTTVYIEDFTRLESELQAVEETVGTAPLDGFTSLADRIGSKQDSLGFTPENTANKSTSTALGTSDTLFPTQKAVKTYTDTGLATKEPSLGFTAVPNTRQVNGHALSADITVTKSDVSLGSVDNLQQMPISYLDTDGTLAANSDAKVASQKAVKTFSQPKDSDLTTIAGLTATTNNFMQSKSSAWSSRTPAQAAVDLLPFIYPIGCIYFSTNSTNPATSLGFGTWSAFGAGKVPVGWATGDSDFGTDEATGGEKTHTLTLAESPAHSHTTTLPANLTAGGFGNFYAGNNTGLAAPPTNSQGGGGAHNNLQPFIVVRMWKRTA